jgi:dihydrofolate reductase
MTINRLHIDHSMNLIVALDQLGIIGEDNKLSWHIPDDLKRFRTLTHNTIVIMGRKTYESLPYNHGLPNRINIVITQNPSLYITTDTIYFTTFENLNNLLNHLLSDSFQHKNLSKKNIFVIGGSKIYKQLIPYCDTLYITIVYRDIETISNNHTLFDCEIKENEFSIDEESDLNEYNNIYFKYYTYTRK